MKTGTAPNPLGGNWRIASQMRVFISGATGYIGQALVPDLLSRGHQVTALCRPGSERKLPAGCAVIIGDALKTSSFASGMPASDTYVHLVGVPHPAPWN